MAELFEGHTANDVWSKAVKSLLKQDSVMNGRTGNVYEILHAITSIKDPKQKWVYNRMPPISIGFALAELVWIMNGANRADVINFWNPSLKNFAGNGAEYHGAYGKRIRYHFGFDQLESAYKALQNIPESRQVVIQIYDTKMDFPIDDGQPRNDDIPCNICSMIKVRNNKIEWSQIMRSNDILLGMPYNFVQFTSLQEILAGWLEIDIGTYTHYSDSLHLYERDKSSIAIGDKTEIKNFDSLSIKKPDSEKIFKEIYNRMLTISTKNLGDREIYNMAHLKSNYAAYNNIMLIIGAYAAQKCRYYEVAKDLIDKCTNVVFVMMWNDWITK